MGRLKHSQPRVGGGEYIYKGGQKVPYIEKRRPEMDKVVELMHEQGVQVNGDLNYILYAFCRRHIKPSYGNYKNYRAELRECADEIGRRLLAPYEDLARGRNGDVA